MIIVKIIILYFIQITHTDDFPSTGTRLVLNYLSQGIGGLKKISDLVELLYINLPPEFVSVHGPHCSPKVIEIWNHGI